jgi:hypothetical protein
VDVFDGSILFHLGALGGDVCFDGIKGMLNPVSRGRLLWGSLMDLLWMYHASILYNEGADGRTEAKGVDMNGNLTPRAPPLTRSSCWLIMRVEGKFGDLL